MLQLVLETHCSILAGMLAQYRHSDLTAVADVIEPGLEKASNLQRLLQSRARRKRNECTQHPSLVKCRI